jgi:hypothetical protein
MPSMTVWTNSRAPRRPKPSGTSSFRNCERLAAKGFGSSRPVADNDSEVGKARNRRVELVRL